MAAEAQSQKDVLVKHGLAESVLESLTQALAQFDQAVDRSTTGHTAHVGASAELDEVENDVVQIVRVMDGLNRARFAEDRESMASWVSVTNTFGPVHLNGKRPRRSRRPAVKRSRQHEGVSFVQQSTTLNRRQNSRIWRRFALN